MLLALSVGHTPAQLRECTLADLRWLWLYTLARHDNTL